MSEGSGDDGYETDTQADFVTHKVYKVLLVEDDEVVLRVVEKLLRQCDYDVCLARNGREALEILEGSEGSTIDVILTDNLMPEVSGIELIYKLVQTERWQHVPVIVMSSESRQDVVLEAIEAGASDFLIKPIRRQELTTLWQHIWRNDRMLRAKSSDNPSSSSGRMGSSHLEGGSASPSIGEPNGTTKGNGASTAVQDDSSAAVSNKRKQPDGPAAGIDTKRLRLDASTAAPTTASDLLLTSTLPTDQHLQHGTTTTATTSTPASGNTAVPNVKVEAGILSAEALKDSTPLVEEQETERQASLPAPQPTRVRPIHADLMDRAGSLPTQWKGQDAVNGAARLMEILAGQVKARGNDAVLEIKPLDLTSHAMDARQSSLDLDKGLRRLANALTSGMDRARSGIKAEEGGNSAVNGVQGSLHALHHSDSCSAFQSFTAVVPRPCARGESDALKANPGSLSATAPNSKLQGTVLPMWAPHQINPLLLQQQQFFQAFQVAVGQHAASNAEACAANRKAAIAKFRAKRKQRNFEKKVRYASRQRLAETRPRVRGQFVKAEQYAAHMAAGEASAPAPAAVPTA